MTDFAGRLDVAVRIVGEARGIALQLFDQRTKYALEEKQASEFVTEADREIEAFIRSALASHFPDDAILGEEMGGDAQGAFWAIDPIDGTANFLRGSPLWGISLGFISGGRSVVGAICYPVSDLTIAAASGIGMTLNGAQFCRDVPFPSVRVASVGESPRWSIDGISAVERALRSDGWGVAEYRCATIGLGYAALGYTDGYIEQNLSIWDLAAGAIICQEAGLQVEYGGSYDAAGMWIRAAIPAVHASVAHLVPEKS